MKKMTKFQQDIKEFVEKYKEYNHDKPFVYIIEKEFGTSAKPIVSALNRIYGEYPDRLRATSHDKYLADNFEEGMKMQDLADKLGINYTLVCVRRHNLEKLGVKFRSDRHKEYTFLKRIERPQKKKKKSKEDRLVGVKVTGGTHKGKYGYLDEDLLVVLHINGNEVHANIESCDYVELN